MKKLLSVIVLLVMGLAVNAQTPTPSGADKPKSSVKFEETTYNFGEIEYGADGSHTFKFKNVSKEPVAIKNVAASCGCTTPSYSKEPIMAGKEGSVTARYDTTRVGAFTKTLTVNINDETIVLTITGTVKPKTQPTAPASGGSAN